MLAPSRGWRPLLRGILYPPLYGNIAVHVGSYSEEMGPSNWTRANTMCSDLGMRLLTIDSPEEESRVVENISLSNEYVCDLSRYENSLLFFTVFHNAVDDPREARPAPPPPPPPRTKISLISCSFEENLVNLYGWRPLLEGWRPLLRGILDPPL